MGHRTPAIGGKPNASFLTGIIIAEDIGEGSPGRVLTVDEEAAGEPVFQSLGLPHIGMGDDVGSYSKTITTGGDLADLDALSKRGDDVGFGLTPSLANGSVTLGAGWGGLYQLSFLGLNVESDNTGVLTILVEVGGAIRETAVETWNITAATPIDIHVVFPLVLADSDVVIVQATVDQNATTLDLPDFRWDLIKLQ